MLGKYGSAERIRDRGDSAFQHLEQGMLDALPHVLEARSYRPNLVDLVDVDDAALGCIQVAVRCLDQSDEHALNVIPDVPSFGQTRGIADDQWDAQEGSQASDEMSLATATWADEQDVRLLDDNIPEIVVGDDRIVVVSVPSINETFEVVRHSEG